MFSSVAKFCPRRDSLNTAIQGSRHSLSLECYNSGRFKTMKQPTSILLTRTQVKKVTEKTSTAFDPDYLDLMIEKIMKGNSRSRFSFLIKQPSKALVEEVKDHRQNVIDDWNHIHETVIDLGIPEMADVIGGQMFAGNNLRSTTNSCLTLRLADNLVLMTDNELQHLICAISDWPADAGGSDTLMKVLDMLDTECALRCERWELEDNLKFALMWVRYKFRPEQCQFVGKVLEIGSSKLPELRISQLIHYLLVLSYASDLAPQVSNSMDQKQLQEAEKNLTRNFFSLDQTEVAMVYSGLNMISEHGPEELKRKIQDTYGFRL